MSNSRRPSKSTQLQHKRRWIREKQETLQSLEPRIVEDAVAFGLEELPWLDEHGDHLPGDHCGCLGCQD